MGLRALQFERLNKLKKNKILRNFFGTFLQIHNLFKQ